MAVPVLAQNTLPVDGKIVSGLGKITANGNAMTILQSSDRMIANWQSFSIGKDATVAFQQPNASSIALNRVTGQAPTQILGSLYANGQVFLVNPNGVVIGKSGSVQTGAFLASTLHLTDQDFLAHNYHFSGEGGAIVNQGSIKGNVIALIAPLVRNEGSIKGNTALAAGTDALLDFDGDQLLSIQVNASTLAALVENKGLIQADGGKVILTAQGASDALKGIVNNSGTVQAQTIASKGGRILLLGDMQHGEVNVAGTLDASAPRGGDGGFIETSAAKVTVADKARITTRSKNGNTGSWLIDPNDFTIAASGGNITGNALSAQLAGSNVTISTATQGTPGGNGDINVNDTVSWSSNTLTLHAERNIVVNAAMNGSATAGLALEYGQAAVAAGNTASYTVNAPINLASTGSFSTKLGSDGTPVTYTIVTSLGNAGSSNDGTLQGIGGNLSGQYALGANIDASSTSTWNAGAGFSPIGDNSTFNSSSRFTGTFEGLGHTLAGLAINRSGTSSVGLFGYVDAGGVVRNVALSGGSVVGSSQVGQLAGTLDGTVSASHASGSVSGVSDVGGLVGKQNSGTVTGSYANGSVTASDAFSQAGGLVGNFNAGTIANSHATGSVSGAANVGGLVGFNFTGTISNTYATGNVTASGAKAGGLVGGQSGGTIASSHASGTVSGVSNVGGLVGNQHSGTITGSYADGSVTASDAFSQVGGLVGNLDTGTISNSHATGAVSGGTNAGGLVGYNFNGTINGSYATSNVTATGSKAGGLAGVNDGGTITSSYASGQVSGVSDIGGLVGSQSSGTITTSYAAGSVMASAAFSQAGGLVGNVDAGTITNSFATGSVSGTANVGGLLGYNFAGTISNTYATGLVTGSSNVGGLAGFVNNGAAIGNSYWDTAATSRSNGCGTGSSGTCNTTGMSTTSMKNPFTFIDGGWDFASIWGKSQSGSNNGYMVLRASSNSAYDDYVRLSNTNLSKTYGSANPSLGGIVLDGVGTGNVTLNWGSAITTATNAGTYSYGAANVLSVTTGSGRSVYADYGSGALTVNKAPLTVTANDASKTYDGQAFTGGNGVTYSGFVNGDNTGILSGTLSFGGTAQGARNAGSYTIVPSGLSAQNYAIAYANGGLTINKAPLTVTANDASKTYDGQVFWGGNGVTYSEFVNGESAGVLSGTLSFGGTAQGARNAGSYTIVPSGLSAQNYAIAYANGGLTINKATISTITGITASDKTYDGSTAASLNTANVTFNGAIPGDTLKIVSASGSFADKNAGTGKTVRLTSITFGGADADNYSFASATTAITANINKAPLTVTANDASKTYDGQAFAGGNGITYSGFVNGESAGILSGTLSFGGTAQGARNAGSYTIVPSGLSAQNYAIAYANGGLTINKATISAITGITASDKTYDGSTAASLNTANATFNGAIPGDTLKIVSGAGNFENAYPGMNKTVFITGLSLGGADAPNYVLANTAATATANIGALQMPALAPQQITNTGNYNVNSVFSNPSDLDVELVKRDEN